MEVSVAWAGSGFRKFADSKEDCKDVYSGVVVLGKVEECADHRAERNASIFVIKKEMLVFSGLRSIGLLKVYSVGKGISCSGNLESGSLC